MNPYSFLMKMIYDPCFSVNETPNLIKEAVMGGPAVKYLRIYEDGLVVLPSALNFA